MYNTVWRVTVACVVLDGVVCFSDGTGCAAGEPDVDGGRNVTKSGVPCVKYGNHRYLSTLLVSIFFGWTGADRFMLGYTSLGLAKLFTLGMVGTWWLVDLFLLTGGYMIPADGSMWEPFY